KVGSLFLVASAKGLEKVYWKRQDAPMLKSLEGSGPAVKTLVRAVRQLEEYFEGKRTRFDLPLSPVHGTMFQKRVWKELSRIPYGKTCSYRDIARRIRNAKAVRAVGTANGKNPFSVIVPCHRVIAASGRLGGYAGGLSIKSKLLDLER